mgnify:CR=1 FL=1
MARLRPVLGIKAIASLFQSKSNTQATADINFAFNGNALDPFIKEWSKTSMAEKYMQNDRLPFHKKFPKGSVGDVLKEFLGEEQRSSDLRDLNKLKAYNIDLAFINWVIDCHDLGHIMTEYGQDTTGEILRIEFETTQTNLRGYRMIAWIFKGKTLFVNPFRYLKFRKMVKEARKRGAQANNLHMVDWFKYLNEPFDFVQKEICNIEPQELYKLRDPYWYDWTEKHF